MQTSAATTPPAATDAIVSTRTIDGLGEYPRLIRLAHSGSDNGTLVAASEGTRSKFGLAVARSTDGGATWTKSGGVNVGSCCTGLYELPRQIGTVPAGTLLLSGTKNDGAQIGLYRSDDHGRTWSTMNDLVTGGQGNRLGLWEPEFTVDASGRLVAFFSDERHQSDGYSQVLAHVISTDGGLTWGDEKTDVAVKDSSTRPGMARVVTLPNGTYVMAYEVCGGPGCAVYTRTSVDGDNWGDAGNLGTRVQDSDGAYFVSAPGITFVPNGANGGRLVVSGMYVRGTTKTKSGQLVMETDDLTGNKGWVDRPAPVNVTIPEPFRPCANYSSTLLPSANGTALLEVAGAELDGVCQAYFAAAKSTP